MRINDLNNGNRYIKVCELPNVWLEHGLSYFIIDGYRARNNSNVINNQRKDSNMRGKIVVKRAKTMLTLKLFSYRSAMI